MQNIKEYLRQAITAALPGGIPSDIEVELETPRDSSHGDLSTNIAFILTARLKTAPRRAAEEISRNLSVAPELVEKVDVAGAGFINFTFSRAYLLRFAEDILSLSERFGECNIGEGKRVNLEFVSANPTGPLNIVSARAAALGDCLKRILNKCGYRAESEFYVNDEGRQIMKLGHSVMARYAQAHGIEGAEVPEDGYHGEYVKEIAADYNPAKEVDWKNPSEAHMQEAGKIAVAHIRSLQMETLQRYLKETDRRFFDHWVHESDIRARNEHLRIKDKLEAEGLLYEKDGAVFFKTSRIGDDEDRVILTSDERPTYFLPDIAYHENKFDRGFEWLIDIWGPDHHGYVPRMKAALKALGHPEESFTVIIAQQVNLIRGGEKVTMSKRAGEMVTMDDLIDEVGVDAARFFFLQRKPSAHLDFDLDLAVKETEENPVFYVQYAHARICSIERLAAEEGIPEKPRWELLQEAEEFAIIRKLCEFPTVVELCARILEPQRITVYLQELSAAFHSFYQKHRVVTKNQALSSARLGLCRAVRITIHNGLDLLGVNAPERM